MDRVLFMRRSYFGPGVVHRPFIERSCAIHAPLTNCYGFDSARPGRTLRRRAILRYHRRDVRCRAACASFATASPAWHERLTPVRAPQSAATLFTFDRSHHVT
jgi:hypothetical protein